MADFVLVHGASHGSWCWRDVTPRLEALGHRVAAIDLPGHGRGEAPNPKVTLADYRDAALAAARPECILVGHSLGGLTITLAAAARPGSFAALVYVAAFVPEPGSRFVDFRREAVSSEVDRVSYRDGGLSYTDPGLAADVFYSDCTADARAFAAQRLTPQPISVMTEAIEFTPPATPRHYVLCSRDKVVLPEYQRRITCDWPAGTVHVLNTDHSPFLSDPDGLVAALGAAANV